MLKVSSLLMGQECSTQILNKAARWSAEYAENERPAASLKSFVVDVLVTIVSPSTHRLGAVDNVAFLLYPWRTDADLNESVHR